MKASKGFRFVFVILCIFSVLTALQCFAAGAEADFTYTAQNGVATVTGCTATGDTVVPDTLGGVPVFAIADNVFAGAAVTSVTLPDTVKSIGAYAFDSCDTLTAIFVEGHNYKSTDANTGSAPFYSVDGVLFDGSGTLRKYPPSKPDAAYSTGDFGQGVAPRAFMNAKYLETLTLSAKISFVGDYAFYGAANLKKVCSTAALPYMRLNNIGDYAFSGTALTEVYLLSWKTMGEGAFSQCTALRSVTLNTVSVTDPMEVTVGTAVLTLPDKLFEGCTALREINLGKSVTVLADTALPTLADNAALRVYAEKGTAAEALCLQKGYSFRNSGTGGVLYSFENGVLTLSGDGVTDAYTASSPAPWSEYNADATAIVIAGEIIEVGAYAFDGFSKVTTLTVGDEMRKLGAYCCRGLSSLQTIQWGSRMQVLREYCFADCTALSSVALPQTLQSLGSGCFSNCASLTEVDLTSEVTGLGQYTFSRCKALPSIFIPDNIQQIEISTFQNCTALTTVSVGKGFLKGQYTYSKNIGAFVYAPALTQILVSPENPYLTSVDGVLYNKDKTVLVEYPQKKEGASFTLPASVKEIYPYAFYNNRALTTLHLETGAAPTELGAYTCSDCTALREIYIPGSVSTIAATALPTLPDNSLLTVYSYRGTAAEAEAAAKGYRFRDLHPLSVSASFADGILTLSGTGSTTDFDTSFAAPWTLYAGQTRAILVSDGITRLGTHCLDGFTQASLVVLGNSVTEVAPDAVTGCESLQTVIAFAPVAVSERSFAGGAFSYFERADAVHTGTLPSGCTAHAFSFADGTLSVTGAYVCNAYTFFDCIAAFAEHFDDIRTLHFESFRAEDFSFYRCDNAGVRQEVDGNTLADARFTVEIDTASGNMAISFNDLCRGIRNGGIDRFYLVAQTPQEDIVDTDIQVDENVFQRALRWLITLLNRLFALFGK